MTSLDIKEFLDTFRDYKRKRNYSSIIRSKQDIIDSFQNNHRIVYRSSRVGAFLTLFIGLVIFILGLSISIIEMGMLLFVVNGLVCLCFLIPGLIMLRESFFIIGSEGFYYKDKFKKHLTSPWVNIETHTCHITKFSEHGHMNEIKTLIFLSNGRVLDINSTKYFSREFALDQNFNSLFSLSIEIYCQMGNKEQKEVSKSFKFDYPNDLDELIEDYSNCLLSNYDLSFFSSRSEIQKAYEDNRKFILKGKVHFVYWVLTLCLWIPGILLITLIFLSELPIFIIGYYITVSIIFIGCPTLFFKFYTYFIVLGPEGMYFKKFNKPRFVLWNDIICERKTNTILTEHVTFNYKVKTINSLKLNGLNYYSVEFPKKYFKAYFIVLFDIYSGREFFNKQMK